mgnify:CR=1 FL=1
MSEQHAPEKFEETDWDAKPAIWGAALMFAFLFIGIVFGYVTIRLVEVKTDQAVDEVVFGPRRLPPAPRLQTDEVGDLREFLKREDETLTTYQVLDKAKGSVRIPIERAIDLVSEEAGNKQ